MKNVRLILNNKSLANEIYIDGKKISFTLNKNTKKLESNYQSKNDSMNLKVVQYQPLYNRLWWLMNMLFFIISIFGIFDRRNKQKYKYEFEGNISLIDGENEIAISNPNRGENKLLSLVTTNQVIENINIKEKDRVINKRRKLLTLSKVLFILLSIAVAITLIVIYL